jgi:hypothetical protein
VQSPDCDELDFAAAEGPPSNFQAFLLEPSPAFGSLLLQFSFFASWTKGWETWECDELPMRSACKPSRQGVTVLQH